MIRIQRFACNMLQENCYVASDDTNECVVIDCGAYYGTERDAIVTYIRDNKLAPKHLLATHGHLDHNMGNDTVAAEWGLKPEAHNGDARLMEHPEEQARQFGVELKGTLPPVGRYLADGESVTFGNHTLTVLHTPGHSRGSVCFYCPDEQVLFSGDTLFRHSIGRTDLEGGSMLQIIQSLRMLAQLPDDTQVLPGHGDTTTIGEELAHNPYMDR